MRHNKPGYRKWTEPEINYLRRWYQERGAAFVAEKLGRTIPSVRHAAQAYTTKIQDRAKKRGERYMGVTEAAFLCNVGIKNIREKARSAGTAREMATGVLLPESWVLQYRDYVREWRKNEALGWYAVEDVIRIFRIKSTRHMTSRRWAAGSSTYGFAFAERVEMKRGRPTGRTNDGRYAHRILLNPWHVDELHRDVQAGNPLLSDRCGLMLILIQEGYKPIWQAKAPAGYHFDISDTLSVGPFPQAISSWLQKTGALKWGRTLDLTPLGERCADEARNRGVWPVLGSAA